MNLIVIKTRHDYVLGRSKLLMWYCVTVKALVVSYAATDSVEITHKFCTKTEHANISFVNR